MATTRKTMIRKKLRTLTDLSNDEKYSILSMYSIGSSHKEIADSLGISASASSQFIHKHFSALINAHETNTLMTSNMNHDPLKRSRNINEEFLRRINEDGAAMSYSFFFAKTGDNRLSLRESGLDCGIIKAKGQHDDSVLSAIRLRGIYLRSIPEVRKEIERLREDQLVNNPVTKGYVQSLLIEQVQEMKDIVIDDARNRGNLLKAIDMLGKSIGAFTERIEVHEVDADAALDTLIEMSKRSIEEPVESTYSISED